MVRAISRTEPGEEQREQPRSHACQAVTNSPPDRRSLPPRGLLAGQTSRNPRYSAGIHTSPMRCHTRFSALAGKFFHTGAGHDVVEAVVPLVAREFVNQISIPLHRQLNGPGSDPDRGIGHGELVQ